LIAGVGVLAAVGEAGELGEEGVGAVDVALVELEVDRDLLVGDPDEALDVGVVLGRVDGGGVALRDGHFCVNS
jgi:hypothetical protein